MYYNTVCSFIFQQQYCLNNIFEYEWNLCCRYTANGVSIVTSMEASCKTNATTMARLHRQSPFSRVPFYIKTALHAHTHDPLLT